jgi:hypothetical protein
MQWKQHNDVLLLDVYCEWDKRNAARTPPASYGFYVTLNSADILAAWAFDIIPFVASSVPAGLPIVSAHW